MQSDWQPIETALDRIVIAQAISPDAFREGDIGGLWRVNRERALLIADRVIKAITAHVALRDRINERIDAQNECPFKPRQSSAPSQDAPREEIARLAALHGLGTESGLGHRDPPNSSWTREEWEQRILECVPERVEKQCYALADAILALSAPVQDSDTASLIKRLERVRSKARAEGLAPALPYDWLVEALDALRSRQTIAQDAETVELCAKVLAWAKYGIAWQYCERQSHEELRNEARAALAALQQGPSK